MADATGVNPRWLLEETEESVYEADPEGVLGERHEGWMTPMFATQREIDRWYRETVEYSETLRSIQHGH